MPYLQKGQRLRLLVIGGDKDCRDEVERLKGLSKCLQLNDSVTFCGLVEQEMLPYFYSAADLCVFPSHYESFGLAALESLACGTPVVATQVGGIESIIRQGATGYMVGDNNPSRLAEKISLGLSLSRERARAIDSIRESVRKFSWSNIADAIVDQYRSVRVDYSLR